jgi:DNA repair exonuclease SbcCD nuclease subunit
MKILAIGDPHFKADNIPEVDLFISRIEELAKEENPDSIVILGDMLHTHERLHTIPLNKAYSLVRKLRDIAPVTILVGNHDMISNQQFLSENHWMNGMKEWRDVDIVDTVKNKIIDGYSFVYCPYVAPGRFIEALDTCPAWKNATCIFAHQEFQGCKMGAITSVEGDRWDEKFPPVVSGHIHAKQELQSNIYYCGSAMQNAFGESDKNIIPILEWKKGEKNYKLREIDLQLPRKKIIYTDVQSVEEYVPANTEDKVKITISGVYDEFKAFKKTKKYKDLVKSGTKVVFKQKKIDKKKVPKDMEEMVEETDFAKILNVLVLKEKNPFLYQIHELVLNNKEISAEDILII